MQIFKKFNIFFFNLIYGKIKKKNIVRAEKSKLISIKKIIIKKKNYHIYSVRSARIYTTSVHDLAVFENKKRLIDKISYQYRYNKLNLIFNDDIKKNIVFSDGTPRLKKKIKGKVFSMLTGGAGKNNYFHWLFDVLPRLGILENLNINFKNLNFLIPSLKYSFQKETLKLLNLDLNRCYDSEKFKHFVCDEIITVDHPYVFKNNPSYSINNIPFWIIEWLRAKFLIQKKNEIKNKKLKIYLENSDSPSSSVRYIINNSDVKRNLFNQGFKIVALSKYNFIQKIKLFKNAKIIVGMHSAGFANIIFCKKNTKIIELQSSTAGNVFKNLALKCSLDYKKYIIKPKTKKLIKLFGEQQGDLLVNLKKLNKLIKN